MKSHRRIAITVGILFIIGTVSGVLSGLITAPILDAPDYLSKVAENEHLIMLSALFVLSMGSLSGHDPGGDLSDPEKAE